MSRHAIAVLVGCVLGLCLATGSAAGQGVRRPGGTPLQPAFSPYLNLLRRDNPTVLNYFGLVRPELEFRSGIQQLQQDVRTERQSRLQSERPSELPATGHRSAFINFGHPYFGSPGGQAVGPSGGRAAPQLGRSR